MDKQNAEYVVRDFSAVDQQVAEMAKRERALTWKLRIDNLKRLGIPLILLASALAILILALGVFIWLVQQERIVEVEKIVEVTREVPIVSEKIKVVEVPVYIEVPMVQTINTDVIPKVEVQSPLGNLSLAAVERVAGSSQCVNSLSHDNKCVDTWVYDNGAVYDGSWLNGQPHGNGTITFQDGGSISGNWLAGELQKVENETESDVKLLKSVLHFSSVEVGELDVSVGHEFDSGASTQWTEAFCYLRLKRKNGENLRVELSTRNSFTGKAVLAPYKFSSDITKKQFMDAQKACPYSWNGFN